MSLVDHVKNELKIAGLFEKDSDYDGMIGTAVLELIEVFAKQGHSGCSAGIVLDIFNTVARYKTLGEFIPSAQDSIVVDYGVEAPGQTTLQSTRRYDVFSRDSGLTWYSIDTDETWNTSKDDLDVSAK